MNRFLIDILICFVINIAVSFMVSLFISNNYLAQIISSCLIAFIFAIFEQWVDRIHFYKYQQFWYRFFIIGIVFCLVDLVTFLI